MGWADELFWADKDVVIEAVKQDGQILASASEELRADKQVVLEAVKQSSSAFRFTTPSLQKDEDLLLLAARLHGNIGISLKSYDAQVIWGGLRFAQATSAAIAVQGEDAPILTVSLSYEYTEDDEGVFRCEANLMSGASFTCQIPDCIRFDRLGNARPHTNLNDLAVELVAELQRSSEAKRTAPARVFINFVY
eukprot:CAMPEP_0206632326 /NCGR_PEP_ID=MMETSP0325_2-20121206/68826_1 /ASSEMBLY_ACC=CAM_ASM_000347 /TAXON_ID=2866 /ORGANISM="Crypthecodinium cohnii, Strain Seligo" /LENGTH=192 /DNA_ID=CAMNT_0054157803 /DNA_START=15 /DNA_END=590 /DNA_ORIENTATION=-